MKLYSLIRYDLIHGILHRASNFVPVFLAAIIFFIDFYIKIYYYSIDYIGDEKGGTIINFLFYFFQGKEPYEPSMQNKFVFPIVWLFLFLYIAYLTLEYPFRNMSGHGIQVMVRGGSRRSWWFSKCIWVLVITMASFFSIYLVLFLMCLIAQIPITFQFADYINSGYLEIRFLNPVNQYEMILMFVILPIMISWAVNLVQLCLCLFMKRIYAFLLTSLSLFAATYYKSPLLIGNFTMVKRNHLVLEDGVVFGDGMKLAAAIMVITFMIGLWYINKFDILKRDR